MAATPPRRRSPRQAAARSKSQEKGAARAPDRKVGGEARRRLGRYLHREPQLEQAWHHEQSVLGTDLLGERCHAMHETPEFASAYSNRAGRQSSNVDRNGFGAKKMMAAQALREVLERAPPRAEGLRTYASEANGGADQLELGDSGGNAASAPPAPRFEGCAGNRSYQQSHAKPNRGRRTCDADGRNSETEWKPAAPRHMWWEQQQAQQLMFGGLDAALACGGTSEPARQPLGSDKAEASFHGAAGRPAIRAPDAREPGCVTEGRLTHKSLTERCGHELMYDHMMSMSADDARAAMSTFGAGKATWEPLRRAVMVAPPEGDADRREPLVDASVAAEAGPAEKFAGRAGKGTWERSTLRGASTCVSPRNTRGGHPSAWPAGGVTNSRAGEVIFHGRCGITGESHYRADFSGTSSSDQAHAGVASWERRLEWNLPPGRGRLGPASRSTPALRTQAWGPPPEAASPRAATPRKHAGAVPLGAGAPPTERQVEAPAPAFGAASPRPSRVVVAPALSGARTVHRSRAATPPPRVSSRSGTGWAFFS